MDGKPVIYRGAALVGTSNLPDPLALPWNRQNAESTPKPTGGVKVPAAQQIFCFLKFIAHVYLLYNKPNSTEQCYRNLVKGFYWQYKSCRQS